MSCGFVGGDSSYSVPANFHREDAIQLVNNSNNNNDDDMNDYRTLKAPPVGLVTLEGSSRDPIQSPVPTGDDPRQWYQDKPTTVLAPLISSSPFIPTNVIAHLMRRKKNSALGVKFRPGRADEITNMEGALHTFVTPVVLAFLHGDYWYDVKRYGHGMVRFKEVKVDGKRAWLRARRVVISASVQPDFEYKSVMLKVCALGKEAVEGADLGEHIEILSVAAKQVTGKRNEYDDMLREHMVYHLTAAHGLPSIADVKGETVESPAAMHLLETQILAVEPDYERIRGTYIRLANQSVVSLEVLFNSAVQQLRNEISALEALCPQGYVLTIDPPSIFATEIDAMLLNRIQFAALRWLADGENAFVNMKVFAFNDYADRRAPGAVQLLTRALESQLHVQVMQKEALFPGPEFFYKAPQGAQDALLVVHNNSDAFGQNVETEAESLSLDGAIGANSSAAASLSRTRVDLLEKLI